MAQNDAPPTVPAAPPQPAGPRYTVSTSQRDPPVFSGLRGEDVEEWLDNYDRTSACNYWDEAHKLRYVPFYLKEVAKTWYHNHESDFPDWSAFTVQLRQIFGTSAGRSEVAKQKLATRIQGPDESYTSYIEDVLALCRRAQSDMPEADRIRHVLKGINSIAFNALVIQNPTSVQDIISTCQRLDALHSMRLPHASCDSRLTGEHELRALIRTIVREELHGIVPGSPATSSVRSPPSNLRDIIKDELALMTSVARAPSPAAFHAPSYAEVLSRPPVPTPPAPADVVYDHLAAMAAKAPAQQHSAPWRPARPICFYCGIRGHISRFCRRRQQDERRGYSSYERDFTPRSDPYVPGPYVPSSQRSPSPPLSHGDPRPSRSPRRRSPSPFRRTSSPLRSAPTPLDSHSEN